MTLKDARNYATQDYNWGYCLDKEERAVVQARWHAIYQNTWGNYLAAFDCSLEKYLL